MELISLRRNSHGLGLPWLGTLRWVVEPHLLIQLPSQSCLFYCLKHQLNREQEYHVSYFAFVLREGAGWRGKNSQLSRGFLSSSIVLTVVFLGEL